MACYNAKWEGYVHVQYNNSRHGGLELETIVFLFFNTFLGFPHFLQLGFMIFRMRKYIKLSTGIEHLPK